MKRLLRENRILKVIKEGKVALGCGALTLSPSVIEVIGLAGLDFVWIDLEHIGISPYDSFNMENILRTADSVNISTLVRIPYCDEHMIGKLLDAGVNAILISGVKTREEVEKLVRASKFDPPNKSTIRGSGVGRAMGWSPITKDFVKFSDKETMAGIMLEKKEAIDRLDDLLSVKGLGFTFIGPTDLSVSLGVPYERTHKKVEEYIKKAKEKCEAKGIIVGRAVSNVDGLKQAIKEGYKLIRVGMDLEILLKELKNMVNIAHTL
jgi:2-keto-3-deoxy-L-rhamnonate aldolase RhmA